MVYFPGRHSPCGSVALSPFARCDDNLLGPCEGYNLLEIHSESGHVLEAHSQGCYLLENFATEENRLFHEICECHGRWRS